MERRNITKEDIDKVRDIEGFPIAKDEDIIALSDAPYYTACPNPFIKEFIDENGTPYDEDNDDYHCEPFAADVSEGKGDAIYNAHSYHTKVPYKAIMRYILHYTKPGDVVFDGFCGTGMTGVAAQLCGSNDNILKATLLQDDKSAQWGERNAIVSDLSPAATLVAYNYNFPVRDPLKFRAHCKQIFDECREKYQWMFITKPIESESGQYSFNVGEANGTINYTIWSDVFICPNCGKEYVYWDVAVDQEGKKMRSKMQCPHCGCELSKRSSERSFESYFDEATGKIEHISKQVPVLINYSFCGKKYDKCPDENDLKNIQAIENLKISDWFPHDRMCEGKEARRNDSAGIKYVHQFFTKRNIAVMSFIYNKALLLPNDEKLALLSAIRGSLSYGTKMVKVNVGRLLNGKGTFSFGAVTGTLYMPSITAERPIQDAIENKVDSISKIFSEYPEKHSVIVSTESLTGASNIPENSVDYIFTDPPFGDNLNYSELNFIWESWQKVFTNNRNEAIVDNVRHKGIPEYQQLMEQSFSECFRVLKPNHWMTVEFHNSKNAVWNAIQEALVKAGFVIADVRTLDKQQGSFKQETSTGAVKQDLVISVYKPNDKFRKEFVSHAGNEETAWAFVSQHLSNLPKVVDADHNGKIDINPERQAFLLFDRMVAYHVVNGIPVPLDATDFYKGLDDRYLKRDGMYFLPDQVNEYDEARIKMDLEDVQLAFAVTNEKTARQWLTFELGTPQTYAELQPKFMQEVKAIDKYEEIPELLVLLEENFIQDEKGRWYVPDIRKEGDVAKLREKNLLKEFDGYMQSKDKLKLFRSEAIRAGFSKLWKEKNYQAIVDMAERLPEQTIQEDPNLLMYFDVSLSRVQS
jgi:DNA modification methylase/predicted RNA-binding Zn-ribbon protein involved in translation (DUF1610 family)